MNNFHFPAKFPWDWRLEMIFHRYEKETVDLFKKTITPGMVVVDIGAHIGYFTRVLSALVGSAGHIFAFEADQDNFKLLQKNTKNKKNVTLVNKAISDTTGTIDFYKVSNSTGCHSVIPTENSKKMNVSSITLDNFLSENGNPKIDAIKIDIEGGEMRAFQGMRELFACPRQLYIVTEFNPTAITAANLSPELFATKMKEAGFEILQILDGGITCMLPTDKMSDLDLYQTGYTNLLLKKQ
jgi:FkbM family methyltransferase